MLVYHIPDTGSQVCSMLGMAQIIVRRGDSYLAKTQRRVLKFGPNSLTKIIIQYAYQ